MENSQSFTYDNNQVEVEHLTANCLVHFRPGPGWDGTQYGFDWMRIGDVGGWGDFGHYKDIVCKHYKSNDHTVLETNPNAYEGKFTKSLSLFQKLEQDYNPLIALCKNAGKYYCSWLSLFPASKEIYDTGWANIKVYKGYEFPAITSKPVDEKMTATLKLIVDIEVAPDYLEFDKHEAFSISPPCIKSVKGLSKGIHTLNENVTIECLKTFYRDQAINIYAVQTNPYSGEQERKLAGRLYVWKNWSVKRPKILFVKVQTPALPPAKPGEAQEVIRERQAQGIAPNADSKRFKTTRNYLRQALVEIDNITDSTLNLTKDYIFREDFCIWDGVRYNGQVTHPVPLIDHRKKEGKSMSNHLNNKLRMQLGKKVDKYDFIVYFLGLKGSVAGGFSSGKTVVAYNALDASSIAHELLHSFGLPHAFSNAECHAESSNIKPAKCTYEALFTENIMDYTWPKLRTPTYTTWHWQWEIANSGV